MSDEGGEKTEAPTERKRKDAIDKGDILQSRDLATALVMLAGAGWLSIGGAWLVDSAQTMLRRGLTFDRDDLIDFDPAGRAIDQMLMMAFPLAALFFATIVAAIGAPALLGSLGFRTKAFGFKPNKLNPAAGLKKIFGIQGLIELGKSVGKVMLLGAVGAWLLYDRARAIMQTGMEDPIGAIGQIGATFVLAILVMSVALVAIAGFDVPMQWMQRANRLKMSKQEVKDDHKQSEGNPEAKAAQRRRQMQMRGSTRKAVSEATVLLTNPTHFAVALRYRPGYDAAPIVVARGRGVLAEMMRDVAGEARVPLLRYPQLTRALYYTAREGQVIREDLYMAVAAILAFVFNLDRALAEGVPPPEVEVPTEARYDEDGRRG